MGIGKWNFLGKKPEVPKYPKTIVVLCAYQEVKSEVARRLISLSKCIDFPLAVHIADGDALIDRIRAIAATRFLESEYDTMFFIDEDVVFDPKDLVRLLIQAGRDNFDIFGAAYPKKKRPSHFAIKTLEQEVNYPFGKDSGIFEVDYLSTGFMGIQKRVFKAMAEKKNPDGSPYVPFCHPDTMRFYPFFQPFPKQMDDGNWSYLSEDWAFVERAKECGFKIWCDGSIRLGHIGRYEYTNADIFAQEKKEPDNFILHEKNCEPFFNLVK